MHLFKSKKPNVDAVFSKYGDMLYRVALARLGNTADAEDAVQDVFVKYMSAPPEFENESHQKAWFLRVVTNLCNDFARWQKVRSFIPLDDIQGAPAENHDGVRDLLELLSQLPPIYKDVVILHCLEGFSVEETAKILGISLSAAKMRLSRAREILQVLRKEENDVY